MPRTLILILALFTPFICWADTQFSMFYQAPETNGAWVLMFNHKEMSGGKIRASDLPDIENEAKRMAALYCKPNARWHDDTVVSGGMMDGTTALASYVKIPLSKKQPDQIKIIYFTKKIEIVECKTPVKKPCTPGMVCLW